MIKGVIFDMDGLMFDTERLWDTFWDPACEELGVPMPQDLATFYASGRGLAGQYLIEHVQKYFPQVDPQKMLDKVWQIGDARFAQGVPCKPGLKELLALLEERGLPRIVASSSPRNMIEQNLQTTGTARYFHDIVCGADVQHSKPAPGYLSGGGPPPGVGQPRLPGAGGQLQRCARRACGRCRNGDGARPGPAGRGDPPAV